MTVRILIPLVFALSVAACAARNADCRFPVEERLSLDAEAQLAEDLAIRFADRTAGRRSNWPQGRDGYRTVREECLATLFGIVAQRHGVSADQVREATSHRALSQDILILGSLVVALGLVARGVIRRIVSGSLGSSLLASTLALAGASLAFAVVAFWVGDVWSGLAETVRLGNGHASYRVERIPWRQHPLIMVSASVILFWLMVLYQSFVDARHGAQSLRREPTS